MGGNVEAYYEAKAETEERRRREALVEKAQSEIVMLGAEHERTCKAIKVLQDRRDALGTAIAALKREITRLT